MPRSPALCLTWYRIPSYTHSGTESMGTYLAMQLSTCWSFIFISYHIRPAAERVLKIGRQLTKLPVHGLAPIWHTVANFPVFCATMTWINCLLLQCISVYTFTYNVTIYSLWPSVLWRCWLGGRKGIRPVKKTQWWGAGVVICLERGADLHMAQLMPLALIDSCFSKIQIGYFYLSGTGHPGSPGQRAVKRVCVCVCVCVCGVTIHSLWMLCSFWHLIFTPRCMICM